MKKTIFLHMVLITQNLVECSKSTRFGSISSILDSTLLEFSYNKLDALLVYSLNTTR